MLKGLGCLFFAHFPVNEVWGRAPARSLANGAGVRGALGPGEPQGAQHVLPGYRAAKLNFMLSVTA